MDGATHEEGRAAVQIDAEGAHDNCASLGDGPQPIHGGGEHRTGERRVEEEDCAVIEVGFAHVANVKASVDSQAGGTFTGSLHEGGLELDPAGRCACEQRRQQNDLPQTRAKVHEDVVRGHGYRHERVNDRRNPARVVANQVLARRCRWRYGWGDAEVLLDGGVAPARGERREPGEEIGPASIVHQPGRPMALFGGLDTCALPASRNRHGRSAHGPAYPTPTRAVTAMRGLVRRGHRYSGGSVRSCPSNARVIPIARAKRPGPSRRTPGSTNPLTGSPARTSTA